jgi:hypothetical protein
MSKIIRLCILLSPSAASLSPHIPAINPPSYLIVGVWRSVASRPSVTASGVALSLTRR